jgi:hypothetical protein
MKKANVVTVNEAKRNLEHLIEQVIADAEHLRTSVAEARAGQIDERDLLDV